MQLHPLVCTAYNADFDGDQMAVHVPLSAEAQAECRLLMLASNNILNPKDGKPVVTPTQDMVIGIYYLSFMSQEEEKKDEKLCKAFSSSEEAQMAYEHKAISLHEKIRVKMMVPRPKPKSKVESKSDSKKDQPQIFATTVGRLILNEMIPDSLGYYNEVIDKKKLGSIVYEAYRLEGNARTAEMLDGIKMLGFKYSTQAGITVGVTDFQTPEAKAEILSEAEEIVESIHEEFLRGMITEDERHVQVIEIWNQKTTVLIFKAWLKV